MSTEVAETIDVDPHRSAPRAPWSWCLRLRFPVETKPFLRSLTQVPPAQPNGGAERQTARSPRSVCHAARGRCPGEAGDGRRHPGARRLSTSSATRQHLCAILFVGPQSRHLRSNGVPITQPGCGLRPGRCGLPLIATCLWLPAVPEHASPRRQVEPKLSDPWARTIALRNTLEVNRRVAESCEGAIELSIQNGSVECDFGATAGVAVAK
jgi:hypothetical protein